MSELPAFDPYEVLGVDKTTDAVTIKKAYRKLALQKHPDKCSDETLKQARTDEFQRINEAYDILGDEEKRKTHDARVNLDKLRRAVFAKRAAANTSSSYSTSQAAPQPTSYGYSTGASRGAAHYEDRAPKSSYDEDDEYRERARRYASAFESNRYASSYSESREARVRAREQNERERIRREKEIKEKIREAAKRDQQENIREARTHKFSYDYEDSKRRDKSSEDDRSNGSSRKRSTKYSTTEAKYASQIAEAQQYAQSAKAAAPERTERVDRAERPERPGIQRRSSVRDSYANVRRSSATGKPRTRNDEERVAKEREELEKLKAIMREKELEKERLRQQARREQEARDRAAAERVERAERTEREQRIEREQRAREDAARQAAALRDREMREREERERERERERQREHERERERETRGRARERDSRFKSKENVEPYEARPSKLQAQRSEAPKVPLRTNTDPAPSSASQHPPISRASTMDSVSASNSTRKRESPSKLSSMVQEPDYSSSSTAGEAREKATRPSMKAKTTSYRYTPDGTPVMVRTTPKYDTRTVEPRSSRARSPTVAKPSVGAERMANLATGSRRPSTSYETSGRPSTSYRTKRPTVAHTNSSNAVPRVVERERGRERDRGEPLYGERPSTYGSSSYAREYAPSSAAATAASSRPVYSRQFSHEDVNYSGPPRRSRREDPYAYGSGMGGYRQGPPMQQVN